MLLARGEDSPEIGEVANHFHGRKRPCRWRIALYSPGAEDIGHLRRNLLIAQALAAFPTRAIVLLIAEAREAKLLDLTSVRDFFTLPALCRGRDDQCRARYLAIDSAQAISLRSKVINAVLECFLPDVLIVDHWPRGAFREIDTSLQNLRVGDRTRCVLGLSDLIGDPAAVGLDWDKVASEEAIRDYYDTVWIYGDPAVYDPVREYQFGPGVTAKVRYTGYLNWRSLPMHATTDNPQLVAVRPKQSEPLMLCLADGGQDGNYLAESCPGVQPRS